MTPHPATTTTALLLTTTTPESRSVIEGSLIMLTGILLFVYGLALLDLRARNREISEQMSQLQADLMSEVGVRYGDVYGEK